MNADRKDWEAARLQRQLDKPVVTNMKTETQRAAAILGDKLVNDPKWAKFQEEAARQINKALVAKATYQATLMDASTVSAEAIAQAKIGFHAHQAIIDSFEMMMDFPNKHKSVDG